MFVGSNFKQQFLFRRYYDCIIFLPVACSDHSGLRPAEGSVIWFILILAFGLHTAVIKCAHEAVMINNKSLQKDM